MPVTNYFDLNKDLESALRKFCDNGVFLDNGNHCRLDRKYHPDNARRWRSGDNPFDAIASSDDLWEGMLKITKLTMNGFFQGLAMCQGFIMDTEKGPERDGAKQMLRKHWYAWAKTALQRAADRFGTYLMDNGTPDSEALNGLISSVFGKWNKDGLITYAQFWIENASTQFYINPNPIKGVKIMICCEKDAAFQGVVTTGIAMGALAVYSGGGKSSRSGIELLYNRCLRENLRNGEILHVLVISDWDQDGEAVIAPTFVEQLSTYIPKDQIVWTRVGVYPEQIEKAGYNIESKLYECKWDVGGMTNYLDWCQDHALYTSDPTGEIPVTVGTDYIPSDVPEGKAEVKAYREQMYEYYKQHSPHGIELDALTRSDYCGLLIDGLFSIMNEDEFRSALSAEQPVNIWSVMHNIKRTVMEENESLAEAIALRDKARDWFATKMEQLEAAIAQAEQEIEQELTEMVNNHQQDDSAMNNDEVFTVDKMRKHMQEVRMDTGQCSQCWTSTAQCRNPSAHRDTYWKETDNPYKGIYHYQPFSQYVRTEALQNALQYDEQDLIDALKERRFTFPTIDIDTEE